LEINGASSINGEINIPGDKSISHRSAIISALTNERITITNFLFSQDCINTLEILKSIGVKIETLQDRVIIYGCSTRGFTEPEDILYAGNSGTTIRLMCGLLSSTKEKNLYVITGDPSINKRPMQRIIGPLKEMGAIIFGRNNDSQAPIVIFGSSSSLKGKKFKLSVSSAQVKSCITLAALFAEGPTEILQPQISRDHTERMLEYFGADILYDGKNTKINPGKALKGKNIFVPSDLSSAAFFIVAGLILKNSKLSFKDIGINPTRKYFLNIIQEMGANLRILNTKTVNNEPVADIEVSTSKLKGIILDKKMIPNIIDEIPALCVAAAFAEGTTVIEGAGELRFKESDRISSISSQFVKAGIDVMEKEDGLVINGNINTPVKGGEFESFSDHRIAMALAILLLKSKDKARILGSECINTSFPGFIYELKKSLK
jgi:3-phosphoshikimate 1-carboxyvinyltransferase